MKLSVVIPAYNAENTIERCILSIQNQIYNDLEIIVINDGSTDNTEKIIKAISDNDCRVKPITIPNGGVSHARNVGIDSATGEYITFVDSDDYIDKEMYSTLMSLIDKHHVKIAHCSYKNVDEDGKVISVVGENNKIVKQNHDEALECLLNGRLFAGGMCNKVFSTDLFVDVRLEETIKYNEDVLACFLLFDKVESSIYTDYAFYNYVAVSSSSTHSANSVLYCQQCLYVSRLMQEMSVDKPYFKYADERIASKLLVLFRAYVFSKSNKFSKEKREIKNEILKYKKQGFYSSKRDKLSVFLFCYAPWLYKFVYKTYSKFSDKKLDPEQ